MKKAMIFCAVMLAVLMVSCKQEQANPIFESKAIVVALNLPVVVIKYYHIQNTEIIDSVNTKVLIIKDMNSFESIFAHNDMMMDSATFHDYYLKSVKEEDFEKYYVVAVISPVNDRNVNSITINEVYLQDSILYVNYKNADDREGFRGFTLAYIEKCNYTSVVGTFVE